MFKKVRGLFKSKVSKVCATATTAVVATSAMMLASADTVTPPDISSTMTTAIQTTVNQTISCMAAVAPIALTVFTFVFVTRKVMAYFKTVSNK